MTTNEDLIATLTEIQRLAFNILPERGTANELDSDLCIALSQIMSYAAMTLFRQEGER
jgi:hypothetical protein